MNVLDELQRLGAVYLDRHFVYASGKHGPGYICMDPMFADPALMREVGFRLGVLSGCPSFDVIVAPATGGIALGPYTTTAFFAETGLQKPFVWADKTGDGGFAFERLGFAEHLDDMRVLIVEDLLTTGGSVIKVREAVEACGGSVVGVSAVCNRGGVTKEMLGVPDLYAIAAVTFEAVAPDACPYCETGVPIVTDAALGHGAEYEAAHPDYHGGYVKLLGS